MLNKVQLIGFTGADAEIRTVSGGKKVATLRVATNRYTKKDGDRKDYTTWHQVEIWNQGTVGWLEGRHLPKGSKVFVEGEIVAEEDEAARVAAQLIDDVGQVVGVQAVEAGARGVGVGQLAEGPQQLQPLVAAADGGAQRDPAAAAHAEHQEGLARGRKQETLVAQQRQICRGFRHLRRSQDRLDPLDKIALVKLARTDIDRQGQHPAGGLHPRMIARKIIRVQEQPDPAAALIADPLCLVSRRLGQEQMGPATGRGDHDPALAAAQVRVLPQRDAQRLGFPSSFTIYDQADTQRLTGYVIRDLGLDAKKFPPRSVHASISAAKNDDIGPIEYRERAKTIFERKISDVFTEYQARLLKATCVEGICRRGAFNFWTVTPRTPADATLP